jgi:hypothetical protein
LGWILGAQGFAEREVKFWEWDCISAPGLLGVLGTGARISVDILELGSYLVGREELGFGRCFAEVVKEASGQTEVNSIRFRYLFQIMHCFNLL